jgi:hypothetical protein
MSARRHYRVSILNQNGQGATKAGKVAITLAKSLLLLAPAVLLSLTSHGRKSNDHNQLLAPPPFLEVDLSRLGYRPEEEPPYQDQEVFKDPSVLYDDSATRLTFGSDNVLAIYLSHFKPMDPQRKERYRGMEGFFVSAKSGVLLSRRTWEIRKRHWVNNRWDTEARIFAVHKGFLVHAAGNLIRYSTGLVEQRRIALQGEGDNADWSVAAPPLGNTIHLQRIVDREATGEWLDSWSFSTNVKQSEVPGVSSASNVAVVARLASCYEIRAVGKPPEKICPNPCRFGSPLFLTETEILSEFYAGFQVLSTSGQELWGRQETDRAACGPQRAVLIANHKRSLDGSRFAISMEANRSATFDGTELPSGHFTLMVYDSATRSSVLRVAIQVPSKQVHQLDFDLSPSGDTFALMFNNALRIYKIPK